MYGIQEAEGQANNKISITSPAVKALYCWRYQRSNFNPIRVELNDILLFLSSCQNINQLISVVVT